MSYTDKHQLFTITKSQLREAYKKQIENKQWNFFDERKHVENLLCQRFNFLILAFSLFVTSFSTIDEKIYKFIVLIIGFIVIVLISLTIIRAFYKLDVNLKILYKLQEAEDSDDNNCVGYNAMSIIDNEIKMKTKTSKRWLLLNNMNKMIGIWIPLAFIAIFGLGIITMGFNIWGMGKEAPTSNDTNHNHKIETPITIPKAPVITPSNNF